MNSRQHSTVGMIALILIGLIAQGCSSAPQVTQFATPDTAAQSFAAAVRANDQAQLRHMLGADMQGLMNSGDPVADQLMREKFLKAYDQKKQLIRSSDDRIVILSVGPKDWPLPMPIVKDVSSGKWYFDGDAGIDEIINRRIGQNELDVIQVCGAIVDAQREYAALDPDHNGIAEYARKIISDPGTRNGLYWKTEPGESASPLGPLVAEAVEEGYGTNRSTSDQPRPYHGYFYRLLKSQGANAPGGAMDYEVNGRMIGGFALIAYPADYGNSGIMSFMVSHHGVVYQKDLGEDTERLAKAMNAFDPGPGWNQVTVTSGNASTDNGQ